MKAYKGFNKNMTCRDFQYKEGGKYETPRAKVCEEGFHACLHPLDCFDYYEPGRSVYHEVDLDGKIDDRGADDTKVAATKIKIGARLDIAGLVKAAIDFVLSKVKSTSGDWAHSATSGDGAHSATSGDGAHSATSGYYAHSATSGNYANSATSGNYAHSATSGNYAHSATSGYKAHSATSGDGAHSATSGDGAHSATSGDWANSATSGDWANSATSGDWAHSEVKGKDSIAAVLGKNCNARGGLGCWLVLTERDDNGHILGVKAVCIDGKKYKPDTWYALRNGEVVEVAK